MNIVVLTAVSLEKKVVIDFLKEKNAKEQKHKNIEKNGIILFCYSLRINKNNVLFYIATTGQGESYATIATQTAIENISDSAFLFFVGTCGGLKEAKIGDVILVQNAFDFLHGKIDQGRFLTKPRSQGITPEVKIVFESLKHKIDNGELLSNYFKDIGNTIHIEDIGTSPLTIADSDNSLIKDFLNERYYNLFGVDKEGYGFYSAAFSCEHKNAIMIKGVSDNSSSKDQDNDDSSQPIVMKKVANIIYKIVEDSPSKFISNVKKVLAKEENRLTNSVYLTFCSFNIDPNRQKVFHLGHCFFVYKVDELIKRGNRVVLFICDTTHNLSSLTSKKYNEYLIKLDSMIRSWTRCFNSDVEVFSMGNILRDPSIIDKNLERSLMEYISDVERSINLISQNEMTKFIKYLEEWRNNSFVNTKYLASFEKLLSVTRSDSEQKQITDVEIISTFYSMVIKPSWYSKDWIVQFVNFFKNKFYDALSCKNNDDLVLYEANRNSYTWYTILFFCKKMSLPKIPKTSFFDNIPNILNTSYMKSADFEMAITKDSLTKLNNLHLSPDFVDKVSRLFKIKKESFFDDISSIMNTITNRFSDIA